MSGETTVQLLQGWVERVQNAISVLHELEAAGVIPKGTVKSPARAPVRAIIKAYGPNRKVARNAASPAAGTKRCNKCQQIKPLDDYPKHKDCRDGHTGRCKACGSEKARIRYHAQTAHTGPLPFSCDVCHAKFSSRAALDDHGEAKHP